MINDDHSCRISSGSIRTFATALSEDALRIILGKNVLDGKQYNEDLATETTSFPVVDSFTYGLKLLGVAYFQQSDDQIILGRVKFFDIEKMAWRNDEFEFDDHSPVATVEFLFDRKKRVFSGASGAPTVTFRRDYVGELCAMGLGSSYEIDA